MSHYLNITYLSFSYALLLWLSKTELPPLDFVRTGLPPFLISLHLNYTPCYFPFIYINCTCMKNCWCMLNACVSHVLQVNAWFILQIHSIINQIYLKLNYMQTVWSFTVIMWRNDIIYATMNFFVVFKLTEEISRSHFWTENASLYIMCDQIIINSALLLV